MYIFLYIKYKTNNSSCFLGICFIMPKSIDSCFSGSFIAPGLPPAKEKEVMTALMATYGKTFLLWQTDRGDKLPLGKSAY